MDKMSSWRFNDQKLKFQENLKMNQDVIKTDGVDGKADGKAMTGEINPLLDPDAIRKLDIPGNNLSIPNVELIWQTDPMPGSKGYLENLASKVIESRNDLRQVRNFLREGKGNLEGARKTLDYSFRRLAFYFQEFTKEVNRDLRQTNPF